MNATKETILGWLGKDTTAVYKIKEGYDYMQPADDYTIEKYMKGDNEYRCWYMPSVLSFGDYDNSCAVERSNVRIFLEEYKDNPWIKHYTGVYGHEAIWIDIRCDDERIIETLTALANYPAMNDEDVSAVELEMEDSDWGSWIFDDLKRALTKKFGSNYDEADEDSLRQLYEEAKEKGNIYYEVQAGGTGWVDVEKVAEHIATPPPRKLRCNQCNMLSINGTPTHETGCPNSRKVYDFDEEEWVTPQDDNDDDNQ